MPSWVLPAVAAELGGVSVEHVLAEVAGGRIGSRTVGEFLFVDVAGDATGHHETPQPEQHPPTTTYRRSLAWTFGASDPIVTAEERDALLEASFDGDESVSSDDHSAHDPPASGPLSDDDVPNWDEVRARVSRLRRPPTMREAA